MLARRVSRMPGRETMLLYFPILPDVSTATTAAKHSKTQTTTSCFVNKQSPWFYYIFAKLWTVFYKNYPDRRNMYKRTRPRTWKSCASALKRSGTLLINEWSTVQSQNGTRDCEPALQLMKDISNVPANMTTLLRA